MTVAAALGRLGGVVHQHDRAVAGPGDLAEHDRDRFDLLVAVLGDLVGLDEGVDDEGADLVRANVLDAGIDVGHPDHGAGAIDLGDQERPVGAAVQRQAALTSSSGMSQCCSTAARRRFSSSASSSLL